MKLIIGLGNPGKRYEKTRHNVGYDALDLLAEYFNINIDKLKFKAIYGETNYKGEKILLIKPETYMNNSGDSVVQFVNYYNIAPEDTIVLVDDIDIKFPSIRIKGKGSAGTHNGLKSLVQRLNTDEFHRVKIAVNQKPSYMDLADFVLSKFSEKERILVDKELQIAKDAVIDILEKDINYAMNIYNSKIIE